MTTTATMPPAARALQRIDEQLDLSGLCKKLRHPEHGDAPAEDVIALMEAEYRKFLALRLAHPGTDIVPCELVDEMWHRHILDTRAYAADCRRLFGAFMHHDPYFGLNGPDDILALDAAYGHTLELYRAAFGEPPAETWISTDARRRCRTQCRPMRCR